jgi:Protein of unknown function (DUF1552)
MKKTFNRRILLRGLGGACVAAPFLPSIAEREAKAQGMTAAAPKRLIVYFTYHGCLTNRWFPAKSHGPLSTAEYMALPTLAPLAPFAPKLLMPRGIRAMNEWSFEGTLGQKNDPHTNPAGSMFTAFPLTPNSTTSSASNPGKFDAKPTGRSLDHIAAAAVNKTSSGAAPTATTPGAAPLFMQIGGVQGSATNNMNVISWSDAGTIFPGQGSPTTVFSSLSNLFGTGPMNADTYRVVRGRSVIDTVREDLRRLNRMNMSAVDQQNLNRWTELLHYTGGAVSTGASCNMTTATQLGLPGTTADITKTANAFMDLAVLTSLCDANRVIFMKMPANANLSRVVNYQTASGAMMAVGSDAHSISHRIGNAGMGGQCVADAINMIHAIDKYYAQQFAYLVGKLDMFTEGDVKLLDNTATVWIQEMSDGNSHNLNNLPILQAGSCGGYFKTGQAINVEGAKADMSAGKSDSDCANGQSPFGSLDGVGTPATVATMPINKYFCNLLNAIGAKAGADGYAAPGGTAPVTKFGKYDDTKLFADGGTRASVIANPGEYMELRAS